MESGPQYPPTGMELNQEIFHIFKRKLSMDCGPQYPLSGMELSPSLRLLPVRFANLMRR